MSGAGGQIDTGDTRDSQELLYSLMELLSMNNELQCTVLNNALHCTVYEQCTALHRTSLHLTALHCTVQLHFHSLSCSSITLH